MSFSERAVQGGSDGIYHYVIGVTFYFGKFSRIRFSTFSILLELKNIAIFRKRIVLRFDWYMTWYVFQCCMMYRRKFRFEPTPVSAWPHTGDFSPAT